MITDVKAVVTDSLNPFYNISVESRLIDICDEKTMFLYLWRNENTVVVGKFQNAFKECNVNLLESEGGHLLRRMSGGGAVYHDSNNLNFTFVSHESNFDLEKQMSVILKAVRKCGIKAELNGRNDIAVEGRKFSGNAFLTRNHIKMHHGTILIDSDGDKMMRYLTVSQEKMKSKGVDSVKSRVINLKELDSMLTTGKMALLLLRSFGDVFELPVQLIKESNIDLAEIEKTKKTVFENDDWRFGTNPKYENSIERRFSWGGVDACFHCDKGVITEIQLFSDALDVDEIDKAQKFLKGKQIAELTKIKLDGQSDIFKDIVNLF